MSHQVKSSSKNKRKIAVHTVAGSYVAQFNGEVIESDSLACVMDAIRLRVRELSERLDNPGPYKGFWS